MPLAHIAQIVVVQENHLHGALLLHDGTQFLNGHLETTITAEHAHRTLGSAECGTYGGWYAKAHCTATTACNYATGMGVLEITATEQLVLTHIGDHNGLVVCGLAHTAHYLTHEQRTLGGVKCSIYHLVVFLLGIGFETIYPCLMLGFLYEFGNLCQCLLAIAQHGHCGLHYLAHLGGVYLEVNNLCLLGIGVEVASNTVVKAHTHGDKQVALVGHHIGSQVAMHAQHTHVKGMMCGSGRKTEHGLTEGNLCLLGQSKQLLASTCYLHALTNEHQRLHALVDEFGSLLYGTLFGSGHRVVAADEIHRLGLILYQCRLCILGKVQYHRTGTTALGNIESTRYSPGDILGTAYLVVPLADGLCHTHYVHLLKGIRTQHGSTHLTAYHHHGSGVYHGICHTGDGVHGTGTRGNDGTSHLATHTGIALSCMYGSLLVAHQYVMQRILVVVECIVGGHDGTTGISEEDIHTLVLKRAHQCLGTCYLCCFHFLSFIQGGYKRI